METMNEEVLDGELIPFDANNLKVFDPFESQLKKLAEENKSVVFDYEDAEGNRQARSHIYKFRQTKSALEKARKQAKQCSLDYGRAVDNRAKEIAAQLDDMMNIHLVPIEAIEQREKDRIAAHQVSLAVLKEAASAFIQGGTSEQIQAHIDEVSAIVVDAAFEEFQEEAKMLKSYALSELKERRDSAAKLEAEAAEQERIRKEEEERQRKEREEKIRAEAEAKAKREAEEATERERQEVARRELEAKQREEKLAREKAEAEARAERAAQEAREQTIREQAAKEAREKAEREARERDKAHRSKCNREARDAFMTAGITEGQATELVKAIASGSVPRVSINY